MARKERIRKAVLYPPEVQELAEQVGGFIEYWGFKRIHGRVWTYLYLSTAPLDAGDLMRRFKVTKGFLSIALSELLDYDVIVEAGRSPDGTQLYGANLNITQVILNVLRKRERLMLAQVASVAGLVGKIKPDQQLQLGLDAQRIGELKGMIDGACLMLESIVGSDEIENNSLAQVFGSLGASPTWAVG